jgi:predicted MFS family arabinose efflux permease
MTAAALSSPPASPRAWGAVLAMSLAAFVLVASEFMPMSLLTPIVADLHITEGQAGQAIAVSGMFALLTSLCISSVVGRLDRKVLLLLLTLLMMVWGLAQVNWLWRCRRRAPA